MEGGLRGALRAWLEPALTSDSPPPAAASSSFGSSSRDARRSSGSRLESTSDPRHARAMNLPPTRLVALASAFALVLALPLAGCIGSGSNDSASTRVDGPGDSTAKATTKAAAVPTIAFDLPLTRAPYEPVHANWKQRLDQPYVYVDYVGDYRLAGDRIVDVFTALRSAGIAQAGPPFILYYDDPARVPIDGLRARVAIPTQGLVARPPAGMAADVLPSTTVVYAFVAGPYPEVPRSYPGLFAYLKSMNWVLNGPVREIYHVSPADVDHWDALVCEVQLPATQAR